MSLLIGLPMRDSGGCPTAKTVRDGSLLPRLNDSESSLALHLAHRLAEVDAFAVPKMCTQTMRVASRSRWNVWVRLLPFQMQLLAEVAFGDVGR